MNRLFATVLTMIVSAISVPHGAAQESEAWWHGTFIAERTEALGCAFNDTVVTYEADSVIHWDQQPCSIEKKSTFGDRGVALELSCFVDESGIGEKYTSHAILIPHEDGIEGLVRCPADFVW